MNALDKPGKGLRADFYGILNEFVLRRIVEKRPHTVEQISKYARLQMLYGKAQPRLSQADDEKIAQYIGLIDACIKGAREEAALREEAVVNKAQGQKRKGGYHPTFTPLFQKIADELNAEKVGEQEEQAPAAPKKRKLEIGA